MKADELSPRGNRLMWATAAAFALIGLVLFVAPSWSAANFAWSISPMVAMTMGGWYLGSAVLAGLVALRWRWSLVHSCALFVGLFGLAEAGVLLLHSATLRLDALLTWPYIAMLALAIAASVVALLGRVRQRRPIVEEGAPAPRWVRATVLLFAVFVAFLGIVALTGRISGQYGEIFPEPLSLFTLQSFGAFYLSLALSVLPLLGARRLGAITLHVQGGLALIVLITLAALLNLGSFNFAIYPRQSIYLGVYLAAGVLAVFYLWYERSRRAP